MCNTKSLPTISFKMMPKSVSEPCSLSSIQCLPKMPHRQRSVTTEDCKAAFAPTIPARRGSIFMEMPLVVVAPPRYPTRRASIIYNVHSAKTEGEEATFDPPIEFIYVPTTLDNKDILDCLPTAKKSTGIISPSKGFFKSLTRPPKLPCRQRTFENRSPAA